MKALIYFLLLTSTSFAQTATVTVRNRAATDRVQWSHATIPFQKGVVKSVADLYQYSIGHGALDWRPIKWHFDKGAKHSISLAALKFPVYLEYGQEQKFTVAKSPLPNNLPYALGPNLAAYLNAVPAETIMFIVAKEKGNAELLLGTFLKNGHAMHDGPHHKALRWRSQFKGQGLQPTEHALSWTVYMDLMNRQDFGSLVVSIGNNTFEKPHSGGIELDYVDLYYRTPLNLAIRNPGAYGVGGEQNGIQGYKKIRLLQTEHLADGSAHTFRGQWSVVLDQSSLTGRSARAELAIPLYGVTDSATWEQSKAAGIVGNIMPPRGNLKDMRAFVEAKCTTQLDVRKSSNFKYANKKPGATGDQPAFSSNMPQFQQETIVAQSSCPIVEALHGLVVEEYRPSYFWYKNRRMNWRDTGPTCFWWSGRPHYSGGHNGACPEWKSRSSSSGFVMGPKVVDGEDDQHWGNPLLQAGYELTGDLWMFAMIQYRQSMALWNKLGDYDWQSNRLGSERSVRLAYNATQLLLLAPDGPVASDLPSRLARHMRLRINGGCFSGGRYCSWGINSFHNAWGVYGLEAIYGDNRHLLFTGTTPGGTCINGNPCEENRGIISWWSGFSMTFAYQMLRTGIETQASQDFIDKYMSMRTFYFEPSGYNAGGRRLNNWALKESGFTQSWHSGWLSAVEAYGQGNPDWAWFRDTMLPWTRANAFRPDRPHYLFGNNDKWYQ